MKELHHVYLKYAMGELEHDAIMDQARRCGVDSVKKFLSMIVRFEIDRMREEYLETLTEEDVQAYREGRSNTEETKAEELDPSLDDDIPF